MRRPLLMHCRPVALAASLVLLPALAFAQTTLPLGDVTRVSPATGQAAITFNPTGPDDLVIQMQRLEPNQSYTVYLGSSPESGALPAQLLGEFRANASGNGSFAVRTEVDNAIAPANPKLTTATGVAPAGAGTVAAGGVAIPLDWIRIYRATPASGRPPTLFGTSERQPGGAQVAASLFSINQEARLTANIGPDFSVRAPRSIDDVRVVILNGSDSIGNVVSYKFDVISTPARQGNPTTETLRSSCIVSFETANAFLTAPPMFIVGIPVATPVPLGSCLTKVTPPPAINPSQAILVINGAAPRGLLDPLVFQDLAGQRIVVRLTVTDRLGNTSSDDLTINLTR